MNIMAPIHARVLQEIVMALSCSDWDHNVKLLGLLANRYVFETKETVDDILKMTKVCDDTYLFLTLSAEVDDVRYVFTPGPEWFKQVEFMHGPLLNTQIKKIGLESIVCAVCSTKESAHKVLSTMFENDKAAKWFKTLKSASLSNVEFIKWLDFEGTWVNDIISTYKASFSK